MIYNIGDTLILAKNALFVEELQNTVVVITAVDNTLTRSDNYIYTVYSQVTGKEYKLDEEYLVGDIIR